MRSLLSCMKYPINNPALMLFPRPGCLVPTTRAATTRSKALPAPKVIRATSHTTRATTRRGKMCETLHKKTSADRGDLTCPPPPPRPCLQLTDCPTSAARLQPWEVVSGIKTSTVSVSLSSFSGVTSNNL